MDLIEGEMMINWLMSDLMASILIIVLFMYLLVLLFSPLAVRKKRLKLTMALFTLAILITIPIIGHSDWNRKYKLINGLNKLRIEDATIYSDKDAVKEIVSSPHPLQLQKIKNESKIENAGSTIFFTQIVEIGSRKYNVRMAATMYPLTWTPFQTWKVNLVTRAD